MNAAAPRQYAKAIAIILAVFAVGLIFYWIFSAQYGDGLEKTMERAGVAEKEQVYSAPLGYGGNYAASFAMGTVGFFAVLAVALVWGKLSAHKADKMDEK